MFSYQWDSQAQVISVREKFASLGIPTWMDIVSDFAVPRYCILILPLYHFLVRCCLYRMVG